MLTRIGVDVGGVIVDWLPNDGNDTLYTSGKYLESPAVDGAFKVIGTLVQRYGAGNVYIVSKCREVTEARILAWLDAHNFYRATGFLSKNISFCRQRADKAPIVKTLGLGHFIDDHEEVLRPMKDIVPYRYLFGEQRKNPPTQGLIVVKTWHDVLARITQYAG